MKRWIVDTYEMAIACSWEGCYVKSCIVAHEISIGLRKA